jgi:hypothetical protein
MNCTGIYEVDVLEPTGEIVHQWKSKNVINYGFVGGLFKHLWGVGNTNGNLGSTDPNKTVYIEKAGFGKLYLSDKSTTPDKNDNDDLTTYAVLSEAKDLTGSGIINLKSVVFDTGNKKITMTIQVTYGPTEALAGQQSKTWYSMIIAGYPTSGTSRLDSRVLMGSGVPKTNTQTLRVRYNFSIQVA